MSQYDYDFFVIGAGSGGVRASRIAASLGARVGICEEDRVGGTCVIRGCVPKKLMVYAAEFEEHFRDAHSYGWTVDHPTFDWATLIANKDKEIDRLNGIYKQLLSTAGVELIEERGELIDAHTVRVGDRQITARYILIAVGGWPSLPEIPGKELAIRSNEAFHLPELPRRIAVYGGGYIAVEFAGIFHGLGAETTLVYRGDKLLRGFDDDVRESLTDALDKRGIRLKLETRITALEKSDEGIRTRFDDGSTETYDQVMFATGRAPKIEGLGLDKVGVELVGNAVKVDEYSRTSVDNIFAVGDVTDRIALTPVALAEGQAVAHTLFGENPVKPDHDMVPSAVFSQPNVATVGYTETQAREQFGEIDVYMSSFRTLKQTLTPRTEKMMLKLIVESATQKVIGCHIVGEHAAEILQGTAIAIKMGATKQQFDQVIGIHPTAAEELVTMRTKLR